VRPFAASAIAVLTAWGSPRVAIVAGLLGGALGLATHATKLGIRAAIDTSPEPFTNGAATAAELCVVAALAGAVWRYPWISLALALLLLVSLFWVVRALWRLVRRTVGSLLMPPADRS
jgi:pimeloyl-ACP methyl ester carboxylesterase